MKPTQPCNRAIDGPATLIYADDPDDSPPSRSLDELKVEIAFRLLCLATMAGGVSMKISQALLLKPEQQKVVQEAGRALADLRRLAGMTPKEVRNTLKLRETPLLKAIEDFAATFSIELMMRVAGLYSRDDLMPFILKYTRTYFPAISKLLDDREVERLPLYIDREREFINPYPNHDRVSKRSGKVDKKSLPFTRTAVEIALHFLSKSTDHSPGAKRR